MPDPVPIVPTTPRGPGRFRRVLGAMGSTLGLTLVFVTSMVGAILLHLDMGPTRRTAQRVANQIFAESFKGKLVVGEIDRLTLHGVSIRGARAYDPSGAQVVDAVGLRADADVVAIVESAAFGTGDLRVLVSLVRVDHADVALERGPEGAPTSPSSACSRRRTRSSFRPRTRGCGELRSKRCGARRRRDRAWVRLALQADRTPPRHRRRRCSAGAGAARVPRAAR